MNCYTTGQISKILNVSRPTLYKICSKKGIKPIIIGKKFRYTEIDLKKLLDEENNLNIEQKISDVFFILRQIGEEIWGKDQAEKKLMEILKENHFCLNKTVFK